MRNQAVHRTIAALVSALLLMTLLGGCGKKSKAAETPAPAAASAPVETAVPAGTPAPAATPAPVETPAPAETAAPVRQDGERFETVIILEGMEETVRYEHIRNEALGIEMDYDYESFVRRSEPDRECFVSVWDQPAAPENYLEVTRSTVDAETVAASVRALLSQEYDLLESTRELDLAGSALRIEASEIKGSGRMADQLQAVYIIPASDGCRVATAHYAIEAAEGFGRRFAYLMNTLAVIDGNGGNAITDEQALAAVRRWCCLNNPDLQSIVDAGEYPAYWEIESSGDEQVVVLYRAYTGALVRYYIDRASGDAHVTEFVPGITPEEMPTDERFNAGEYLSPLTGTWQTASMAYEADGSMAPEYHVRFTETDVLYGHMKDGAFVFDHADPIFSFEETAAGGWRVQARAANSVYYSYQTSESVDGVLEYYETWNADDFPAMYRGGASLSRCF